MSQVTLGLCGDVSRFPLKAKSVPFSPSLSVISTRSGIGIKSNTCTKQSRIFISHFSVIFEIFSTLEFPPASQEMAQMRKQCLDYHYKEMEALKEVFKEYLIELFFLQHLQGNMMDFLAFKKKHYAPLQAYLRQNDLDIEEEEEEEEEEEGKSEVINDEVRNSSSVV